MKKIVIDRSKWRCGGIGASQKGYGETELLNENGYMCCLGQMLHNGYKVPKKDLLGASIPEEVNRLVPPITRKNPYFENLVEDTALTDRAMIVNDSSEYTQRQREQKLRKLFREEGVKLEFVGRTVRPPAEQCT